MCENMLAFQNRNQDKYDLKILSLFRSLHLSSHLKTEKYLVCIACHVFRSRSKFFFDCSQNAIVFIEFNIWPF